jgi:hypothetical protein
VLRVLFEMVNIIKQKITPSRENKEIKEDYE